MKRGVIIINALSPSENSFLQVSSLKNEFDLLGVAVDIKQNDEIIAYIDNNGEIIHSLQKYDFILYLDKDPYVANMLSKAGIRMFNNAESIFLCDDKMRTHIALANEGIAMPKTIASPLIYEKKIPHLFKEKLLKLLSFPFVIKEVYGSLGLKVYLVHNEEELDMMMDRLALIPHLYQEFIKESKGRDARIIVIGGKVVAAMERRSSNDDFRSNIGLGGRGYKVELSKSFIVLAEKVAKILNLDYCGVDILFGKDNLPILCEVNSNAYFNEISKVTNINIAALYARYIFDKIK